MSAHAVDAALVVTRYRDGGSERRIRHLAEVLTGAGCSVAVVCGTDSRGDRVRDLEAAGAAVELVPGLGRALSPVDDLRAALRLRGVLRRLRPVVAVVAQQKASALVRTLRPRGCVVVNQVVMDPYDGVRPAAATAVAALERVLARRAAVDVFVGHDLAARCAARVRPAPGRRRDVIRSPMPDWVLHPPARDGDGRPGGGVVRVGFVGTAERRKRFDLVLDGAAELRARGVDVEVLVAGFEQDGGPPWARFLGFQHDVAGFLRGVDVVVLPSQAEGLPQVLVQAAALGVPFVVADVAGAGELLAAGAAGVVVEREASAIASGIAEAAVLGPGRLDPGFVAGFDPDVIAGQWLALLADVTGGRVPGAGREGGCPG